MTNYLIGNVLISIDGDHKVIEELKDELKSCETEAVAGNVSLAIKEVSSIQSDSNNSSVVAGGLEVGRNYLVASSRYYQYKLIGSYDGGYSLEVCFLTKRRMRKIIPKWLASFLEMSNLSYEQLVSKTLIYNCLDYIVQNILLTKGKTFLHASTFTLENKALVFSAWGGVGKTTTLLKFLKTNNAQYLSDDLAILGQDGEAYRNPKRMQVYAYNMQGEEWLKSSLLSGRSMFDLVAWNLRKWIWGIHKVRRRVAAEDLFPSCQAKEGLLVAKSFYLERGKGTEFYASEIGAEEFAERASNVLLEELSPFVKYSTLYHNAFPGGNLLMDVCDLKSRSKSIIQSSLKNNDRIELIRIPEGVGPVDIYSFISGRL